MNKNDLIARVAEITGFSKTDSTRAVEAVQEAIIDALSSGDEVRIAGFGTYTVVKRAATEGRNPRTGAVINIPASRLPKFRAGKALKDAVNEAA